MTGRATPLVAGGRASRPGPAGPPAVTCPTVEHEPTGPADPDLDAIGADLAAVESALARLDDGSYWTDPFPTDSVAEQ